MNEWWSELSQLEHIYWIIAFPSSLAFIIQLIMTFFGADADADVDIEVDGDFDADDGGAGTQFFTIKNLIAFFTIFSWTGIACLKAGVSPGISVVIAFVAGLLMMWIMTFIFYLMSKLTHSGSLDMRNAIGQIGEVYLTIPEDQKGMGKVQVKIQGALRELDALTLENQPIPTGKLIKITEITSTGTLIVEPVKKEH
jgi:hypothetical protein